MTTLGTLYREMKSKFTGAGIETSAQDAKLLLSYALGCAPNDVLLKPDTPARTNAVLDDAIARRLAYEPVSKIMGTRGFYGLEFEVNADVLDPRPDTETLIDAARKAMPPHARLLDICTGSGCIPLTLLSLFPQTEALAVDISEAALSVAQRNAEKLGYANRITFKQSNWAESVLESGDGLFDIITCNPPYIPTADIKKLEADVKNYDPILALDGGDDGLNPYRILFPQILGLLKTEGAAFFEIGIEQAKDVKKMAVDCGFEVFDVVHDLGGIERVVCVRMAAPSKK